MTDYLPLLSRAVAGLDPNNDASRRAMYDRARQALLNQLRGMNPPLAEAEITRERLALEDAIRRIELQQGKGDPGAPPPREAAPASPPAGSRAPAAPPPAPAPSAKAPPDHKHTHEEEVHEAAEAAVAEAVEEAPPAAPVPPARDGRAPAPSGPSRPNERPARVRIQPPVADASQRPPRTPEYARADYARADARKAMQARILVGAIVGGLVIVAALIGYFNRGRIMAAIGMGSPSAVTDTARAPDRISGGTEKPPAAGGQQQPAASVAQRAILYEENPGSTTEQLQTFAGTAVWRTETVNPGPGRPPELGLRVDVEIPDRKMTVSMTIRRNPDQTLPASHTIEVQFTTPNDPFGGVANLPGIRAKTTETAQGAPLAGLVVRVTPGFFLVGLSAVETDREQNLSLLRERGWLDVPFVYNNGRRAVLVIEKGTPGERAVNEAVMAWGG